MIGRMFAGILVLSLFCIYRGDCQNAPASPDIPWHSAGERTVELDAERMYSAGFAIDSSVTYALPDLIALAEAHNPETRAA